MTKKIEIPFPRQDGPTGDWTIAYYYLYGIKKAIALSSEGVDLEEIECVLLALEQYVSKADKYCR